MVAKLVPCKSCEKEVSQNAKTCPHCGEKYPGVSNKGCGIGCLIIVCLAALLMIIAYFMGNSETVQNQIKNEWYVGGNLHSATVGEWKKATYENKLATSADWIFAVAENIKTEIQATGNIDNLKPYAHELVVCLDEGTKDIAEIENQRASDNAVICMTLMGYK